MPEIRRRNLSTAVWIPLRASHKIESLEKYGYLGHKEEFFGAGSLAVPLDKKQKTEELEWMDVGISRSHSPWVQDGRYIPADVFTIHGIESTGVPLVLEQQGNREVPNEWHLHQDFVIAMKLMREGDIWLCFDEGYIEVARLRRGNDKCPYLMEVRAEHLKDYLCARGMALYVSSYWSRREIVKDASYIKWTESPVTVKKGGDRWEGRVSEIHEGGTPFGATTAVFHVSRSDIDPVEEVPSLGFPTDDQVVSKSWTKTDKGQKLYSIWGELWRKEWVDPAALSPRIRDDKLPLSIFFITDATGTRENRDSLTGGIRWLWFRPDVIMALAHRRGGSLHWYTRDTGDVRCSPDYHVHFGVNKIGLINVFAKDIALLPDWQQRIWAGSNVSPEGGVCEELLASQMRADPADTQAPETFLSQGIELLNKITLERFGFRLFREHDQRKMLLSHAHRFRSVDITGFFGLAKDLARLTADSIDASALQNVVPPPKGTKWGSLKSLENVVATKIGPERARLLLGPLVGIFELRHADAHLPGGQLDDAIKLAGVDKNLPFVFQGYQLLHACVSSLYNIAKVLGPEDLPK